MSFLAPYMLWGAVAAGVPIALHFFFRSRYRKVPWAAMQFLLTSIEQTSRRLKFQELLLLLARVAVLVLLALALARPSSMLHSGSGQGDAVDAVLIIDTSYSMAAREGPVTRLDRAKAAALAVIDHLPPHSTAQVIGCADRVMLAGPRTPSNLDQARRLIQTLDVSHLATDFLPGVREASAALQHAQSPNKELYLISDMHKLGWEQQAAALTAKLKEISAQAKVYLVRCGTQPPRNAAVVGIAPQSGIPHTGERVGFAVLVRNSGTEPVRDLTVSLEADGQSRDKDSRPIPLLAPGEARAVALSARLDRAGLRTITASIKSDELDADNRFDQVIHVRDMVRVLVVDGAPNEREPEKAASYYLMHALRPISEPDWGNYHIQPRVVAPRQAAPALLVDQDLCILVNVSVPASGNYGDLDLPPEFVERLAGFVREGHALMIFCGAHVSAEDYNRTFHERHGLLPLKLGKGLGSSPENPLRIDPASADAQSPLAGFREEPLSRIGEVEILQTVDMVEPKSADRDSQAKTAREEVHVALRYSNDRPALATKKVGDGRVMLLSTSADTSWTDWPLRPTYLPFVHVALTHLLQQQTGRHNLVAGEPLVWHPPDQDARTGFTLISPAGVRTHLGAPDREEEKLVVTALDTSRAGVYRIVRADQARVARPESSKGVLFGSPTPFEDSGRATRNTTHEAEEIPFAVVADLRESENLEALTDRELDERLGFPVIHLTAGDDLSVFSGVERLNREWTVWLLAAVLGLALGEAALAWFCGRAR